MITVVALRQSSDYSAYTSMYLLLQLPHGLLAVTLMTTYTPRPYPRARGRDGDLVFKSRIRKAIKFAEAPVRGASVLKYDPKGNAADYYRALAQEVLTNGAS